MKMTDREALEIMLKMWDHIALKNCNKRTAALVLGLPKNMRSHCSLCEYDSYYGDNCDNCLMPTVATFPGSPGCCGGSLAFWRNSPGTLTKQEYARKIADMALADLNKRYPEK